MLKAFLIRTKGFPSILREPLRAFFWFNFWLLEWAKEIVRQKRVGPFLWGCERAALTEEICGDCSFDSVLEVGCAYGQMLTDLACVFPEVKFVGIDPDYKQIESGSVFLTERGISNVVLETGNAVNLSKFEDNSFDVVFSSAAMLFLSSQEIGRALTEMKRVARQRILILDLHDPSLSAPKVSMERPTYGEYSVRNWEKLLAQFFKDAEVEIVPISKPLWVTEYWQTLGAVMSIRFA